MRRSLHYEAAFAHYLREARIPYVAVDEARKTLIPPAAHAPGALKSFDFVLYGPGQNLLVDVKGRRLAPPSAHRPSRRLECWATRDDLDSLLAWERLFGEGFAAAL